MYRKRVKKQDQKSQEKIANELPIELPIEQEFKPPSPVQSLMECDKIIESSDDEVPPIAAIVSAEPENNEIDAIRKRLAELKSGKFIKPKEDTQIPPKPRKKKQELTATEKMHATVASQLINGKINTGDNVKVGGKKKKKTDEDYKHEDHSTSDDDHESVKVRRRRKKECQNELNELNEEEQEAKPKRKKKVYPKRPPMAPPEPDSNDEREDEVLLQSAEQLSNQEMTIRMIVILNNSNLRLDDNPLLKIAVGMCADNLNYEIIPIYCFLPDLFCQNDEQSVGKFLKEKHVRGILNTYFILENVKELKQNLINLNCDLIISRESPHIFAKKFFRKDRINVLVFEQEIATVERNEEYNLIKMAYENKVKVCKVWGSTIYHINDIGIPLWKFPHLFGRFKRIISEANPREPVEAPNIGEIILPKQNEYLNENSSQRICDIINYIPTLEEFGFNFNDFEVLDNFIKRESCSEFPIIPGEAAALKRMKDIISDPINFEDYFYVKNKLFQDKLRKTNLYPWINTGCLSPRRLFRELTKFGLQYKRLKGHVSYYKVDLLWKDFLRFWALKNKNSFFTSEYGVYDRNHYKWNNNSEVLKRVKSGNSGMPLIDALIRCFNQTGYISPRGIVIFAHYFSQDLRQDWRIGADYFQSHMLEYEACNITGGWHIAAGIGPGKIYRFHVLNQGLAFDPDGEFIKCYVPELKNVPIEYIQDPYRMPSELQTKVNVVIGVTYTPDFQILLKVSI